MQGLSTGISDGGAMLWGTGAIYAALCYWILAQCSLLSERRDPAWRMIRMPIAFALALLPAITHIRWFGHVGERRMIIFGFLAVFLAHVGWESYLMYWRIQNRKRYRHVARTNDAPMSSSVEDLAETRSTIHGIGSEQESQQTARPPLALGGQVVKGRGYRDS